MPTAPPRSNSARSQQPPSVPSLPLHGHPFRPSSAHPPEDNSCFRSFTVNDGDATGRSISQPQTARRTTAPATTVNKEPPSQFTDDERAAAAVAPPQTKVLAIKSFNTALLKAASRKPTRQTPRLEAAVRHDVAHAIAVRFFGDVRAAPTQPVTDAASQPHATAPLEKLDASAFATGGTQPLLFTLGTTASSHGLPPRSRPQQAYTAAGSMKRVHHDPLIAAAYFTGRKTTVAQLPWSAVAANGQEAAGTPTRRPEDASLQQPNFDESPAGSKTTTAATVRRDDETIARLAAQVSRVSDDIAELLCRYVPLTPQPDPSGAETTSLSLLEALLLHPSAMLFGIAHHRASSRSLPPFVKVLIASSTPEMFPTLPPDESGATTSSGDAPTTTPHHALRASRRLLRDACEARHLTSYSQAHSALLADVRKSHPAETDKATQRNLEVAVSDMFQWLSLTLAAW